MNKMITHPEPQGSPEWAEGRAGRFNAGDAGAMLSCDPNRTRTELLDQMVNGFSPEAGAFTQKIWAEGHRLEALARPLAEKIIGEELYPVVGSLEVGLSRPLGASFDGLTIGRTVGWEHKQLNEALRAALPHQGDPLKNDASALPKHHRVQMESHLMTNPQQKSELFTASDWDADGMLIDARHCWYTCDVALRQEIMNGWLQLEADEVGHIPVVHKERPAGEKIEAMPVLVVQVEGRIVSSNLAVWREAALAKIAGINRELKTDQDFADAKEAGKWCEESEAKLKLLKQQTLEQMVDVNEVVLTLDKIVATLARTRIDLRDDVATRETAIRQEVAQRGAAELGAHMVKLEQRVGGSYLPSVTHPLIAADFQKAIKSKRTVKSLNDAVNAEVARAKIAASNLADRIQTNLKYIDDSCADHLGLFADSRILLLKECDDFKAIADGRVNVAKADAKRKEDELRESIRLEEQAKADREARRIQVNLNNLAVYGQWNDPLPLHTLLARRANLAVEPINAASYGERTSEAVVVRDTGLQALDEAIAQREAEARQAAAPAVSYPPLTAGIASVGPATTRHMTLTPEGDAVHYEVPAANAPTVRPIRAEPATPPTLALGHIAERLGFQVTAAFLSKLGFEPAARVKTAVLYHEARFDSICVAIISHIHGVRQQHQEAA